MAASNAQVQFAFERHYALPQLAAAAAAAAAAAEREGLLQLASDFYMKHKQEKGSNICVLIPNRKSVV